MSADRDDEERLRHPSEFLRVMVNKKLDIPQLKYQPRLRPEAISARLSDHWPVETSKRVEREFRDKLESDLADAVKRQDWQTVAIIARNLDRIDNQNRPQHTSQI